MAIGTGRATIFGFPGGVSWTGIGTLYKQSGEFSDEFDKSEVKDDVGKTRGLIACDRKYRAKLVFTPVAASGTNTIANARLSLVPPAELAAVQLTGFDWSLANYVDATTGLKWVYDGGWKISGQNNGVWSYELNLMASDDQTIDLGANRVTYQ